MLEDFRANILKYLLVTNKSIKINKMYVLTSWCEQGLF